MMYVIRGCRENDLNDIYGLAKQFSLLNLVADRNELVKKIEKSLASFSKKIEKKESQYLFVMEDLERRKIIGVSQIIAKHGTPESPHYYFKIIKKDKFSQELGVGFIHQVLRLGLEMDGPTEIGGLLVDPEYRNRPEKIGQQMSLIRFLFMKMQRERFENKVLCELTPPLTDEGRSEFWEALGRRFTGMSYTEADELSQKHKEFIATLFPQEDIYLCLLDSRARLMIGRVGAQTAPAQKFLEKMGFKFLGEVDPFDGGPHWGAMTDEIVAVKESENFKLISGEPTSFNNEGLVASYKNGLFYAGKMSVFILDNTIKILSNWREKLELKSGDDLWFYSFR